MTIPTSLLPEIRSTYRTVLRASRLTFQGDIPRRAALENAARATFSSPTLTPPSKAAFASHASSSSSASASSSSSSSPATPDASHPSPPTISELRQRLAEWNEVALFLRRNVVQGQMDETGAYRLRVTKDTELNNNLDNSASTAPSSPPPKRDPSRKCGDTPPEAPAYW